MYLGEERSTDNCRVVVTPDDIVYDNTCSKMCDISSIYVELQVACALHLRRPNSSISNTSHRYSQKY